MCSVSPIRIFIIINLSTIFTIISSCDLFNGSYVPEGTFFKLEGPELIKRTDVVFIVEAKPCNKQISTMKNIMQLVNAMEKEFLDANITDNR